MAIENFCQQGPLGALERLPYTFYLGGSRFMEAKELQQPQDVLSYMTDGNVYVNTGAETDYDFYATYSEELLLALIDHGFSHTVSSIGAFLNGYDHYMDNEAVAIVERDNVQVVLRKDALFYKRVFDSISVEFYAKYLWKSSPYGVDPTQIQPIFNALFAAAHAMEGTYVTD